MAVEASRWRRRHWRHAAILAGLTFTGLGLFLPNWRTALGGALPWVQALHDLGGMAYGVALVGWAARFFPWPPQSAGWARWGFAWLAGLSVTGIGLLVGPTWVHALATVGHASFAAALVLWTLWHLVQQRPRRRRSATPAGRRWSRRRFLRWAGAALVSLPALGALPDLVRVATGPLIQPPPQSGPIEALPGFIPYTVVGGFPTISAVQYRLKWTVAGAPRKEWSLAALKAMPRVRRRFTFHCVTGWAVPGLQVEGVELAELLRRAGWDPGRFPWVRFLSGDGVYTESLSAGQIRQFHPLVIWSMDGRPLPVAQGYPVRLVVPGMYGYKSIKWLVQIDCGRHDRLGYWEVRGYPQDAFLGSYRPWSV
ncbi:MAG: molybdopterin-dependent oxidoreductase [Firmicutes bacterium]|nr:molybdopterin-dependent oxidoreductase [Alicyclobacillaceae bacterium]MCL6496855.1 molybdopterin-dependent oxidoreductase [Bacillota bacterium]